MCMVREDIRHDTFQLNDFTASVGAYEHHFISGSPEEKNDWRTIINPFDKYVWSFLLASVVTTTTIMILVNKIQETMIQGCKECKEAAPTSECEIQADKCQFIHQLLIFLEYLGILFCLGAVIDESQGNQQSSLYMNTKGSSRAPKMLVLMWLIFCFIMSHSYRSLLRANMIKVDYKPAIDTIDDVLQSKIKVTTCGDCNMPEKLKTDPRPKVKELAKQFEFFQSVYGKVPENVEKGYFSISSC